jgi:hypothetical protein
VANLVLIAEAAQGSSYTPIHIALLLRKGKVKGKKVGGTWLVDLDDLQRYEAEMNELGTKKHDPTKGSAMG